MTALHCVASPITSSGRKAMARTMTCSARPTVPRQSSTRPPARLPPGARVTRPARRPGRPAPARWSWTGCSPTPPRRASANAHAHQAPFTALDCRQGEARSWRGWRSDRVLLGRRGEVRLAPVDPRALPIQTKPNTLASSSEHLSLSLTQSVGTRRTTVRPRGPPKGRRASWRLGSSEAGRRALLSLMQPPKSENMCNAPQSLQPPPITATAPRIRQLTRRKGR